MHIATQGSAKVYGQPQDLGALQAGKLADMILVDLSGTHHQPLYNIGASLVYSARSSDVQTVICDGQILMRDRKLLTIDKDEVIANVRAGMHRLVQKVPGVNIQIYGQ